MNQKYLKRIVASYVREKDVPYFTSVKDPAEVARQFKSLETRDREEFISLHLDKGHRPICWDRVAVGSISEVSICLANVFKTMLISNAAAAIFLHNHPSGKVEPSPQDRAITEKLLRAADLLGIKVLDHLIIGEDSAFFSFKEHGLI